MTRRQWLAAAAITAACAGITIGAAAGSDRVLSDRSGYIRRDPALPSPTGYVRRPLPMHDPWETR